MFSLATPVLLEQPTSVVCPPWVEKPHDLISLWDMEQFGAQTFFLMGKLLEKIRLVHAPQDITSKSGLDGVRPLSSIPDIPAPVDAVEGLKALLVAVSAKCGEINLKLSKKFTGKLYDALEADSLTNRKIANELEHLEDLIKSEMEESLFFYVPADQSEYYKNPLGGWEQIVERFPDTTRDVEEMNKCFALSRYTASMFHALHVAEWGAIALGDYIGVVDPKKGWGPTQKKLGELLKAGHSKLPPTLAGKFEFLEQMGREIDSMMLAWRHKVDHAANHLAIVPNAEFGSDIAEHIIGAVKVFMGRLADGIPK
jgi:hypothetical protein